MTQRILVTGVAGFIASKVCARLLSQGAHVVGVDNLNDAYDVRMKQWRLQSLLSHSGFEYYTLDITDRLALGRLCKTERIPFDAVVNLAARAGVPQSQVNPHLFYETNVIGTLNLLELSRELGIKKFVLASTSSLYGAGNPMPYREDADTNKPLSPYAASKKAAETLSYTYHYLYGIDVSILRFFTVYGPAGRPDMSLFRFTQWICEGRPVIIYGDGTQGRDFTYVDDIARGVIAALAPMDYQIINLGSDRPIILLEAIHLIEERVGKTARLEFKQRHAADVPNSWADIHKAQTLLDWYPQTAFEDGLTELVRWYQANREWARDIQTI